MSKTCAPSVQDSLAMHSDIACASMMSQVSRTKGKAMARSPLDEADHRILDILRMDARASVADIARSVQLSPAPVTRRIGRLERLGVIRGYVALIDDRAAGILEAFTEIRLHGGTETSELEDLVRTIPEVQEFFTIAGDPDAMVRIRVDDVDHLQRVVNSLRRTGKVTGTKTLIVMYRWNRQEDNLEP